MLPAFELRSTALGMLQQLLIHEIKTEAAGSTQDTKAAISELKRLQSHARHVYVYVVSDSQADPPPSPTGSCSPPSPTPRSRLSKRLPILDLAKKIKEVTIHKSGAKSPTSPPKVVKPKAKKLKAKAKKAIGCTGSFPTQFTKRLVQNVQYLLSDVKGEPNVTVTAAPLCLNTNGKTAWIAYRTGENEIPISDIYNLRGDVRLPFLQLALAHNVNTRSSRFYWSWK